MKKNSIIRCLLGFPLGVFIGYTITILISFFHKDGSYVAVVPTLIDVFNTEISAVTVQYILCGILGMSCAAGSLIWEHDHWSILKQTVLHFLLLSFTLLPIAYLSHWMEHSIVGVLSYFGIFIIIYVVIWLTQYVIWKKKIKELNKKIQEVNR